MKQTRTRNAMSRLIILVAALLTAPLAVPLAAQDFIQEGQFRTLVRIDSNRNNVLEPEDHLGKPAAWSSDRAVLYWAFDPQSPEALVRVLDGRSFNGHWWLDLAVISDLVTATGVTHTDSGEGWFVITGPGRSFQINDPEQAEALADRLVHCLFTSHRPGVCQWFGSGTTVSLRDAWDSEGRIPAKYLPPPSDEP